MDEKRKVYRDLGILEFSQHKKKHFNMLNSSDGVYSPCDPVDVRKRP